MVASKEDMVQELIENNLHLQEKIADLVTALNKTSRKLGTMIDLFEEAAQHIKQGTDEPLTRKLEALLEQNKNIARGLILLEKYVREKTSLSSFPPPKPLPKSSF